MLVIVFLCILIGPIFIGLSYSHYLLYNNINLLSISLILFLIINSLICYWELALCYQYNFINKTVAKLEKDAFKSNKRRIILMEQMSWKDIFSFSHWAYVWIDYSKYDPSYADSRSFGFAIDVGNGHTTLLPSLFIMISIVTPILNAKITGMIGLILFYQTLYGTVLYFFSYIKNGYYKRSNKMEIFGIVVTSNMIWIIFPLMGIYMSYKLIMTESFQIVQ